MDNKKKYSKQKIHDLKDKKRLKNAANRLKDKNIEQDIEEGEKFLPSLLQGNNKYEKKLTHKFDEFGTELTPFNLTEELEEGAIDSTGFYLRSKNIHEDPWYESVQDQLKKTEYENYLKRQRQRDKEGSEREENDNDKEIIQRGKADLIPKSEKEKGQADNDQEDEKNFQLYGEEDLYYKEERITEEERKEINEDVKKLRISLIEYLTGEETVNGAIKRLKPKVSNASRNQYKPIRKKQRLEAAENKDSSSKERTEQAQESQAKSSVRFNELLDLVSKLTELSYFDVYSDTRAKIIKSYESEFIRWKYRTTTTKEDNVLDMFEYGPFTTAEITDWLKKGYLDDTEKIKFQFKKQMTTTDDTGMLTTEQWINRNDPIFLRFFQ